MGSPSMIVLIGGEKGWMGKTTLATNVAGLRTRQGGTFYSSIRTTREVPVIGRPSGKKWIGMCLTSLVQNQAVCLG